MVSLVILLPPNQYCPIPLTRIIPTYFPADESFSAGIKKIYYGKVHQMGSQIVSIILSYIQFNHPYGHNKTPTKYQKFQLHPSYWLYMIINENGIPNTRTRTDSIGSYPNVDPPIWGNTYINRKINWSQIYHKHSLIYILVVGVKT